MPIRDAHLLRCPNCDASLEQRDKVLRCSNGHDFDIARQGYVNLTASRGVKKAPDTAEMVAARERFLEAGYYDPLLDRISGLVSVGLNELEAGTRNVIDVGCGPGFYLKRILAHDRIGGGEVVEGVAGVDLSKAAVRRAASELRGGLFVVADVEEGIPVASGGFGVVLSVFAPRPVPELRRIVRDDGRLVLAAAGPAHLRELREELGLLEVHADKEERLVRQLSGAFSVEHVDRLGFTLEPDERQARDLVAMGPNFWHRNKSPAAPRAMEVTADFLILVARPNLFK